MYGTFVGGRNYPHGKDCRTVKDRLRSKYERRLGIGVIVCAEYSYDRIGPAYCMAVELGELRGGNFSYGQKSLGLRQHVRSFFS